MSAFTNEGTIALALTTGALTAFNPCGFAMLPAYVSYFVGAQAIPDARPSGRVVRAAAVGTAVTAGFATVFGILGLAAAGLRSTITDAVPIVSIVVAIALAALGVAMLAGYEPKLSFIRIRRARSGTGLPAMYVFGISYALVSLSCAFPPFLVTVASTFGESSLTHSLAVYGAFVAGMGLVLITLTVAVSVARGSVVRSMRGIGRYVGRISGLLLVLAGAYIAWYGWYEYQIINLGRNVESVPAGPVDTAFTLSGKLQTWINDLATSTLAIIGIVVAALVVAAAVIARRSRSHGEPSPDTASHTPADVH